MTTTRLTARGRKLRDFLVCTFWMLAVVGIMVYCLFAGTA